MKKEELKQLIDSCSREVFLNKVNAECGLAIEDIEIGCPSLYDMKDHCDNRLCSSCWDKAINENLDKLEEKYD